MKTGMWLGIVTVTLIRLAGCGEVKLDLEQFPREKPVVAGVDGWGSSDLKRECDRLREKLNAPALTVPVHFWPEHMTRLRDAHAAGRPIILVGYSAGYHQSILTAEQCQREGINIDLLIGIDPSYIADHPFYLPANIKQARFYFSSGKGDLMGWARGDEQKIKDAKDSRVESVEHLNCRHSECLADSSLKAELERVIDAYSTKSLELATK